MKANIMRPVMAKITRVVEENQCTKTFTVRLPKRGLNRALLSMPGRFVELTVFGYGEMPLGISSSPYRLGSIDLTVMNVGNISSAMHRLQAGDLIGLRGPFGRGFALNRFRGCNFILIAGGSGFAPIHSIAAAIIERRKSFGKLFLLCGAKTPEMLCFKKDLGKWAGFCSIFKAADRAGRGWSGHRGFVTELIDSLDFPAKKTAAVMCGPQLMMDIAAEKLLNKGIPAQNIFLSLERLMHCGIGKCAHCNINHRHVCIDGPIFSLGELSKLSREE